MSDPTTTPTATDRTIDLPAYLALAAKWPIGDELSREWICPLCGDYFLDCDADWGWPGGEFEPLHVACPESVGVPVKCVAGHLVAGPAAARRALAAEADVAGLKFAVEALREQASHLRVHLRELLCRAVMKDLGYEMLPRWAWADSQRRLVEAVEVELGEKVGDLFAAWEKANPRPDYAK